MSEQAHEDGRGSRAGGKGGGKGRGGGPQRTRLSLGPDELDATLVYRPQQARRRAPALDRALSQFAGKEHSAWVMRELGITCLLDVGGNRGQFGLRAREGGYTGRIVSFEPVPAMAAKLRDVAAADGDWVVHEMALGSVDGTTTINVNPGPLSSLLPSSDFGREWNDKLRDPEQLEIQIRRLDGMLDEATAGLTDPRVFLKLDTQGFDLEVFRGAGARVAELYGLQSELSTTPIYEGMPSMTEQLAAYEAAGFALTGIYMITRDVASMRLIELDAVMIGPAGQTARASAASAGAQPADLDD